MRSSRDRKRRRQRANLRRGMVIIMLVLLMLLLARCAGSLLGGFNSNKYASEIDISKEVEKGEYPIFLQYDSRWDDLEYGDGEMEKNGCEYRCHII